MTGFLTRAALALEPFGTAPVWPAAAAEEVTVLLPLLSENVRDVPVTQSRIARRLPRGGTSARTLRAVRVEGPLSLLPAYDGLSAVWAWALGLQHTSRPTELVEGAYQHLYELDPVAHSHAWPFGAFGAGTTSFNQQLVRRATLAVERTVSVWEHLSTLVRSLSFTASPTGVSMALNLVGHSTDRASATNTPAVLAAIAEPDWQWVEFQQLEARLAPFHASTPLDSDDAISLTSFRLDVSHHLKTRQRQGSGLYIGEPRRDQLPEVKGSLTLPYYDSDTLVGWALAQTVLMAELSFTGAPIGSTGYNYKLCFWLPALQLDAVEAGTQGPADRDQSLNFRALVTATAPAGFPTFSLSGPLYVELVSADAINPLTGVEGGAGGAGGGEEEPPEELGGVTSGLELWFKADDLDGTYADDDPVDAWTDDSGNAIEVTATTTARPTYKTDILGEHSVVRFNGTANGMTDGSPNPLAHLTSLSGFTCVVVCANVTAKSFGALIATDKSGTRDFNLFTATTNDSVRFYSETSTNVTQGTVSVETGPTVIVARYEAGVSQGLYFNGTPGGTSTPPASFTINSDTLYVGKDGFNDFFQGDLAEIAIYDRALTTQERETVEAALMEKYDIGQEPPPEPDPVTWNPDDKAASITLDMDNLRASGTTNHHLVRCTSGKTTGKWYAEALMTGGFGSAGRTVAVGISRSTAGTGNGHQPNSWMLWDDGDSFHNSSGTDHTAQLEYEPNEVVMIAIDMDTGSIWWGVNGTFKGDPAAGTGAQYTNLSDTCHLTAIPWQTNRQITARFAAGDFTYSPPSGFSAWES